MSNGAKDFFPPVHPWATGRPAVGRGAGDHRGVLSDLLSPVPARQADGGSHSGDGPLWAFEQGQLDILSQEADGATVYGGSGCRVTVRNGEITAVTDENMGFSKFYEGGVLTSVTFDNPLAEAAALCTPFSVNSYVQYTVRTPEEARTIRAELDRGGTAALEARGLRCWALGNGYLVVERHELPPHHRRNTAASVLAAVFS